MSRNLRITVCGEEMPILRQTPTATTFEILAEETVEAKLKAYERWLLKNDDDLDGVAAHMDRVREIMLLPDAELGWS